MIPFNPFPKMARLRRECLVTEKIDGTNASVYIYDPVLNTEAEEGFTSARDAEGKVWNIKAGSRNRWITPASDNFDFAKWVWDNAEELVKLGAGMHFGEWWGSGIQRGYGYTKGERFFSLFNAHRWTEHDTSLRGIPNDNPTAPIKLTERAPVCCKVVPILYSGLFDTDVAHLAMFNLKNWGSVAAPDYMNPEGVVVYHTASGVVFKMTIKDDDNPKGQTNVQ